jgi:hypothetical protein
VVISSYLDGEVQAMKVNDFEESVFKFILLKKSQLTATTAAQMFNLF